MTTRLLRVYIVAAVVFLLLPEILVFLVSFNPSARMVLPSGALSLRWYEEFLNSPRFLGALGVSFLVASISSVLSLIIGGASAYAITRYPFRGSAAITGLFLAPLVLPAAALGVALFLFLNLSGFVGSVPGLLVGHVIVTLPYTFRVMAAAFAEVDPSLEDAARSLGAGTPTALRLVVLPMVTSGIAAASIFSFMISLEEFTVSLFVTYGKVSTLPLEIFNRIQFGIDPTVAAASTVLLVTSLAMMMLLERMVGLNIAYVGTGSRRG